MYPLISKQLGSLHPAAISQIQAVRTYAGRIEASSALPSRPLKKIRIGKARPAIYHQFNTYVELSDGSIITRKSQFPKDEYKLIADQRNNPLWNKSKPNMSLLDAEARGKLNKFKNKFSSFEQSGMSDAEIQQQKEKELELQKQAFEGGVVAESSADAEEDDFLSLLGSSYEDKKLGGTLYQREKKSKKKRSK